MDRTNVLHATGWALVLTVAALFGTAQALPRTNTVDSGDIINGEVLRADIGGNAVNSAKVLNDSLTSTDIADGTIASVDILDSSVTSADIAASAVGFTDLAPSSVSSSTVINNSLGGDDINESQLNLGNLCRTGLIHSWARVKGSSTMPSTYTTSSTYVDTTHNCSGGTVEVRRVSEGIYNVRFGGDPAALGQGTSYNGSSGDFDNIVSITNPAGVFIVYVVDASGAVEDGWFVITTF